MCGEQEAKAKLAAKDSEKSQKDVEKGKEKAAKDDDKAKKEDDTKDAVKEVWPLISRRDHTVPLLHQLTDEFPNYQMCYRV